MIDEPRREEQLKNNYFWAMSKMKRNVKKMSMESLVKEPEAVYKRKTSAHKTSEQLLVTPKSRKSLNHLKKLLNQMDDVEDVEVIENDEVVDDELLKKILKGMKSGFTTEAKVMESLNRIIHGK